jgi:hypothetical protein
MKITNAQSNTNIAEVADGIYRISTPVPPNPALPPGFTFNQYLIDDDAPLLFHSGLRKMFPLVGEAIETVMPVAKLRYIGFSHVEADECGSLNEFRSCSPSSPRPSPARWRACTGPRGEATAPRYLGELSRVLG